MYSVGLSPNYFVLEYRYRLVWTIRSRLNSAVELSLVILPSLKKNTQLVFYTVTFLRLLPMWRQLMVRVAIRFFSNFNGQCVFA